MPQYEVDEDGDRILSDDPKFVVKRSKTARLKAMKEADPQRYGIPIDAKSVKRRRETREEMERAEAKRIARRVIPEGFIGVPTVKMSTSPYLVEPALPDPRNVEDHVVVFLREETMPVEDSRTGKTMLYRNYKSWCRGIHRQPLNANNFNMRLFQIMGLADKDIKRIRGFDYWPNMLLTKWEQRDKPSTENQEKCVAETAEAPSEIGAEPEDKEEQHMLKTVNRQLDIMTEQIEIMKTLLPK